jgi:hypothetical protein
MLDILVVLLLFGLINSIVQLSSLPASSLRNFRHRDQLVGEVVEIKQQSSNMNTGLVLLYHDVEIFQSRNMLLLSEVTFL